MVIHRLMNRYPLTIMWWAAAVYVAVAWEIVR